MTADNARLTIKEHCLHDYTAHVSIRWDGGPFRYRIISWGYDPPANTVLLDLIDVRHTAHSHAKFISNCITSSFHGHKQFPKAGAVCTFGDLYNILGACPPDAQITFRLRTKEGDHVLSLDSMNPGMTKWTAYLVNTSAPAHCDRLYRQGKGLQHKSLNRLGLTLEQLRSLINHPFQSREIVTLNREPHHIPDTPFVRHCETLLRALKGNPVKATTTGNLPRHFVQSVAHEMLAGNDNPYELTSTTDIARMRGENSFQTLSTIRCFLQKHAYVRKVDNRFTLTDRGHDIGTYGFNNRTFPEFFKAYTTGQSWADRRSTEDAFCHDTIMVSLLLLDRYGDEPRTMRFYYDQFIGIFPYAADDYTLVGLDDSTHRAAPPTDSYLMQWKYTDRLGTYLREMALADFLIPDNAYPPGFHRQLDTKVKKTPLMSDMLQFRQGGVDTPEQPHATTKGETACNILRPS